MIYTIYSLTDVTLQCIIDALYLPPLWSDGHCLACMLNSKNWIPQKFFAYCFDCEDISQIKVLSFYNISKKVISVICHS